MTDNLLTRANASEPLMLLIASLNLRLAAYAGGLQEAVEALAQELESLPEDDPVAEKVTALLTKTMLPVFARVLSEDLSASKAGEARLEQSLLVANVEDPA